jgi:Carboxypeptidase regulatory-like domain/TonB-dependent Receptor Plug Domain
MKSSRLMRGLVLAWLGLTGAVAVAPQDAFAVGEQNGRIRGVVTNGTTGEPLEAVQVDAKGPALIGGAVTAMTDAKGRFELQGLPPGEYQISFSYPGTVASTRKVTIRQGEALRLNVPYSLQATGVENVAVTEGRQLTRPDSTHTGSVREVDSLNKLPTGRSYQTIAQQVPGVSGGANPNIKGGLSSNNRYLIDGLDVTDPVTNTFAQNLTFDSTQSIDVITGGMDAEYNALGGVVNVITRGGSNETHAVASIYVNHSKLSSKSTFGSNLYEDRQPFNESAVGPTQSIQASVNVGGPIIKQRLWYALTYQFDRRTVSPIKARPLGVPPYDIQHPARVYTGHMLRLRATWAPTDNNRVWLSTNTDPASIDNRTMGNSLLGVAETRQNQGGYFGVLGWEWTGSDLISPSVQIGFLNSNLEIGPQGLLGDFDKTGCDKFSSANCVYDKNRPRHINTFDNTTWYQGPAYQVDNRYRLQIEPAIRIRGDFFGRHNLKLGVQAQFIRHNWDYQVPGGSVYRDRSTLPFEQGLCDENNPGPNCYLRIDTPHFKTGVTGRGIGFYIQDRWWTPLTWLTVNPGIRFDYGYASDWKGRDVATLYGIAPRLGFTADVTRDGRNILFAYYGRNTEPISLSTAADVSSTEAAGETVHRWNNTTKMWTQISASGGPGGTIIDKNIKMPHSDEITAGFRRELVPNTVGSVELTWKKISHQWTSYEVNKIWDPTGSRVVAYVDQEKAGQEVWRHGTLDNPRYYHGVIFSTEGSPSPRWDYSASYTLSWTTYRETLGYTRDAQLVQGFSSADIRHYLRAYGSYSVTPDLVFGAGFQYQSGASFTKSYWNTENGTYGNWRSPAGTIPSQPNDPNAIAEFRTPGFVQADLRVSYNVLPRWLHHRVDLILDVFNVFDMQQVDSVLTSDDGRAGTVASRREPLRVQLGARYTY